MRQEKIQDALNFLDDDLVEKVERLREKKVKFEMRRIRVLSVAACLCLLFLGIYVVGKIEIACQKSSNDNASENSNRFYGSDWNEETDTESALEDNSIDEVPSLVVEIENWKEREFEGRVVEILDTEIFPVGSELIVAFEEDVCVGAWDESGKNYYETEMMPDSESFPVGSIVVVRFDRYENEVIVGEDTEVHRIYAEAIRYRE